MSSLSIYYALLSYVYITNVFGSKPNILFLNVDEMDGRNMDPTSVPQYNPISMPNLRSMGSKGVQFIRHYSNGPQCVCGRAALWSGRRTNDIHVYNNDMGFAAMSNGTLDNNCVHNYNTTRCQKTAEYQGLNYTMLDAMEALGYNVHIYGKLHIGAGIMQMPSQSNATNAAFSTAQSSNSIASITRSANIFKPTMGNPVTQANDDTADPHHGDENIITKCVEKLNSLGSTTQTAPFMLYCSVDIPHPPYQTNSTWLKGVNVSNISLPYLNENLNNAFDNYTSESMHCFDEAWTTQQIIKFRKTYYGLNVQTDHLLGTVMNALFANGFNLTNTYIIFTSDHGEMNLDHRQYQKNSLYEGSARIPLWIAGPNIKSNVMITNLTETVDVFPTIMSLGGASSNEIPSWLSGTSLISFLNDDNHYIDNKHPSYITSQYHSLKANTGSFMVRKDKWKYIQYGHYLDAYKNYKPQLFDLNNDPNEIYDVSESNQNIVNEMENILLNQYNYEYVDCVAKQTDFDIFETFVWNRFDQSQIEGFFKQAYSGFNKTDWQLVVNWRNELLNAPQCESLRK